MSPKRTLRRTHDGSQLDRRCRALEARIAVFAALQKKRYNALGEEVLQLTREVQEERAAAERHVQEQTAKAEGLAQRFHQALEETQRVQNEVKHRLLESITARVQTIVSDREAQAEARSLTSKRLGEEAQTDLRQLTEGFQGLESESEVQSAKISAQLSAAVRNLRAEFESTRNLHAQLSEDAAEEVNRLKLAVQGEAQAESDRRAATEQRVLLLLEATCDKIDALA